MTQHEDRVRLRHMLDYGREASDLIAGKQRDDLDNDRVLCLALVQLLQIIGEAASRVSTPVRDAHPALPWSQIVALRNRLIHGYDTIDLDILWQILDADVPELVKELESIEGLKDQTP